MLSVSAFHPWQECNQDLRRTCLPWFSLSALRVVACRIRVHACLGPNAFCACCNCCGASALWLHPHSEAEVVDVLQDAGNCKLSNMFQALNPLCSHSSLKTRLRDSYLMKVREEKARAALPRGIVKPVVFKSTTCIHGLWEKLVS